jgi:hypothetical protein
MAKARTTDVVAQNGPPGDLSAPSPLSAIPKAEPTAVSLTADSLAVQIEIPLTGQPPPTEFVFHVDCKLTPQQSTVARRIAQQLDFQNACLDNGQRIVNVHGALKWMLEQVSKQL